MNYYIQSENLILTEQSLLNRGYPLDLPTLHKLNVYPIQYNYIEYNPDTYKSVPEDDLIFDESSQSYIQNFKAVKLNASEKESVLQKKKEEKLEQLHSAWLEAEKDGVITSSVGFDIDATERANRDIEGLIKMLEANNQDSSTFCAADNSFHTVSLQDLKTMQLEIIAHAQSLYAKKWEMREAINSAKTLAQLEKVSISFND